ncbi:MAG: AAA family ATPase [Xanthobacteraceae bacterium]|nr:AAA family ATPase [Xanthobacteraceae bacterium]
MTAEPNSSEEQAAVFTFLEDPKTHGGDVVRRLDTHAAAVFLAGTRALKVKRAVRFPFLDYSTLAKRKAACAAEIEVNQPFAPDIYRGIVPITREADGQLAIGGAGSPVEWAVEMARFDEDQTLDHVADRDGLDAALSAKLAAAVSAMHARSTRVAAEPWLAALEDYVGQNTAAFREREALFPAEQTAALDRNSRAMLARLSPLLRMRGEAGFVRRGHGDLHLGNIAVLEGEPVAFDAIEFDPLVASGDVLYDLAFLLMDLVERDLDGAANIVLNGYLAGTRADADYDGLAALPLFMSLRAAIRAKVTAARIDQASESARRKIERSAVRYFQLAQSLLASQPATVVCTAGLSGTGKSVLARSLAPCLSPAPGAIVLRSDAERKAMHGVAETSRLPPDAYRAEVSERLYAALNGKARRIARAGFSVIVDAVFAKPAERQAIEDAARAAGAGFHGLFLTADLATRVGRIGGRGPDASDADAAVARMQEDFATGDITWARVDASGTPAETLARARALFPAAALR